jgi:hypothetical protein
MDHSEEHYVSTRSVLKHTLATILALVIIAASFNAQKLLFALTLAPWLIVFPLVAVIVVFNMDRNDFRTSRKLLSFSGSLTICVAILVAVLFLFYQKHRENAPFILKAGQYQDFNGSSLVLYQDGTYRYCDLVFFDECCHGKFTMRGDTIRLTASGGCRDGVLVIEECSVDHEQKCLGWLNENLPEMRLREDRRNVDRTARTTINEHLCSAYPTHPSAHCPPA